MFAVAVEKQGEASYSASAEWHAQSNTYFKGRAQGKVCADSGGFGRGHSSRSCCRGWGSGRRRCCGSDGTAGRAIAGGFGEEDGI